MKSCIKTLPFFLVWASSFAQSGTGVIYSPLERGSFSGSQRTGIWEYFDAPEKLALKVDYNSGRLLYIAPDTSDYYIEEKGKWVKSKLDIPCRFHGSNMILMEHYIKYAIPFELRGKDSIKTWLTFDVGQDGVASNPLVHNDPSPRIKKSILELFNTAPNGWIAGIKEDGSSVKCRFSVVYRYCVNKCAPSESSQLNSKILFGTTAYKKRPEDLPAPSIRFGEEGAKIQFSPDDKHIMVKSTALQSTDYPGDESLIIDAEYGDVRKIPYSGVMGTWWLDSERILFRYKHSILRPLLAVYDMSDKSVKTISDSSTYSMTMTQDRTKMIFTTSKKDRVDLHLLDLHSGKTSLVWPDLNKMYPVRWSPDGATLLMESPDSELSKYVLLNINTGNQTVINLFNTILSGWSADGKTIYLTKDGSPNYSFDGEVYKYSIETGEWALHTKKIKGLRGVKYHHLNDKFLLIIKDDAYLMGSEPFAKPELIIKNCAIALWSNNGENIAYVTAKDPQLEIWNLKNRQSTILVKKSLTRSRN